MDILHEYFVLVRLKTAPTTQWLFVLLQEISIPIMIPLAFRKRFLPEIRIWFKEILLIGKEMNIVKLRNICMDGTKVQASASRHKAMSYEYIQKLEKQLAEEIEKLLGLAEAKNESEKDLALDILHEIGLRNAQSGSKRTPIPI